MVDYGIMAGIQLYGWDSVTGAWVKILVNAAGKLIIDPSEIFEEPPTDGEMGKAPTSNWAHDHADLPDIHHAAFTAADHTAIGDGAPHHAEAHTLASHTTKAHAELTGVGADDHHAQDHASEHLSGGGDLLSWTDEKLLKGAGAGVAPEEISIPSGGYTEGCRAYHSLQQSIPDSTWTALSLNSEDFDTDTCHDLVTNNSRVTCHTAGKYLAIAQISFVADATGLRGLGIKLNGITLKTYQLIANIGAVYGTTLISTIVAVLALNDYLEAMGYQTKGSALLTNVNWSQLTIQRIG